MNQEDTDLVNSIINRKDRLAENKLYSKYYRKVLGKVRSFKHDTESAKDITSDILVKIFTNLETYSTQKSNFGSWVMSITNNHLIDLYRKDKNKINTISYNAINFDGDMDETKNQFINSVSYSMEDDFMIKEDVDAALGSLKYQDSELLVLKYYCGYDNSELGYHYNTTNDKISFRINYIKKKLNKD
jgi:RNA polymerase sigma-70 factor (ECF subfamily)